MKLEFLQGIANQHIDLSHLANKARYDRTTPGTTLDIGDIVVIKNVGVKGMHKLSPNWLPHEYKVIRCIDGNSRVYEVRAISNPKRKNRVLHIDMLKRVTDLGTKYQKSRQYHNTDLDDLGTQKLFEEEVSTEHLLTKSAVPVLNTELLQTGRKQPSNQRGKYALRSRGKLGTSSTHFHDDQSDNSVVSDYTGNESSESEQELQPEPDTLNIPQHASESDDLDNSQLIERLENDSSQNSVQDSQNTSTVTVEDSLGLSSDSRYDPRGVLDDHESDPNYAEVTDDSVVDGEIEDAGQSSDAGHDESLAISHMFDERDNLDESEGLTSPARTPPGIGYRLPERTRQPPVRFGYGDALIAFISVQIGHRTSMGHIMHT